MSTDDPSGGGSATGNGFNFIVSIPGGLGDTDVTVMISLSHGLRWDSWNPGTFVTRDGVNLQNWFLVRSLWRNGHSSVTRLAVTAVQCDAGRRPQENSVTTACDVSDCLWFWWGEGEGVEEVGGAVVATMVDRLGGHREIHREIYVKLDQHMEIHREIHKLYQHRTALHHAAVHWWGGWAS